MTTTNPMSANTQQELNTAEEFRDFYAAIPEDKWGMFHFVQDGRCCALGHLGMRHEMFQNVGSTDFHNVAPEPVKLLSRILGVNDWGHISSLNDGCASTSTFLKARNNPTPKTRILAALNDAIAKEKAAIIQTQPKGAE
jgi:hypothetical protein